MIFWIYWDYTRITVSFLQFYCLTLSQWCYRCVPLSVSLSLFMFYLCAAVGVVSCSRLQAAHQAHLPLINSSTCLPGSSTTLLQIIVSTSAVDPLQANAIVSSEMFLLVFLCWTCLSSASGSSLSLLPPCTSPCIVCQCLPKKTLQITVRKMILKLTRCILICIFCTARTRDFYTHCTNPLTGPRRGCTHWT